MEAKLQKLKVTELKELLSAHSLPQTGKKDDLVKRLLENNIGPADEAKPEEEGNASTPAASPVPTAQPESGDAPSTSAPAPALTPEQQALKARAERFGMPFNPKADASTSKPKAEPAAAAAAAPAPAAANGGKKEKAGAIDKAPLGVSEEVLARRAAKFGLPEKKESAPTPAPAAAVPAPATNGAAGAKAAKPEVELTPEMKEKIAIEEEKKRKRAEKFGTSTTASSAPAAAAESIIPSSTEGPESKKVKV